MNPKPPPAPKAPAPTGPRLLVPPEERFWKRYSPHNEFPLSGVVTATFYVLVGVALVVFAFKKIPWLMDKEPLPVEPIEFAGGGGSGGQGGNNGRGNDPNPPEDVPDTEDKLPDSVKPKVPLSEIPHTPVKTSDYADVVAPDDASSAQYFDNGNLAVVSFGAMKEGARKTAMDGLRGTPGNGGNGNGGDPGPGTGTGKGKLLNDRQKRVLRWTMMFDTINGPDYLTQLAWLKAYIAVPTPNGYLVIRDLTARPAAGKVEDLKDLKRIFWVDNRPESVRPLVQALGLKDVPDHIVAFFPPELEEDLLKKELKFKGLKEDEIQETRFRVIKRGSGGYVPMVVEQTKK